MSNKPLAYERGWAEFYKLKFKITPDVLIPRPETELLVDIAINFASYQLPAKNYNPTIIDVGTGSGCIAISVAKNIPDAKIIAVDKSPRALDVAKLNAKLNKVESQIVFIENDLLAGFQIAPDIIIANLPYIPSSRIPKLDESVREFEPIMALDGGYDGFGLCRQMFEQIQKDKLFPKILVCEIDSTHADLAIQEAQRWFHDSTTEIKQDLSRRDRILSVVFS